MNRSLHCVCKRGSSRAASTMDPDGYEQALTALSGLISGKKRADPVFWTHAFEGMKVYLQVEITLSWLQNLPSSHVYPSPPCGSRSLSDQLNERYCWSELCVATSQRLDLTDELPKLSVIHVAGTKGKV